MIAVGKKSLVSWWDSLVRFPAVGNLAFPLAVTWESVEPTLWAWEVLVTPQCSQRLKTCMGFVLAHKELWACTQWWQWCASKQELFSSCLSPAVSRPLFLQLPAAVAIAQLCADSCWSGVCETCRWVPAISTSQLALDANVAVLTDKLLDLCFCFRCSVQG